MPSWRAISFRSMPYIRGRPRAFSPVARDLRPGVNSLLTGISQRPWNSICVDLRRPACGQWWPRNSGNCGGTKEELFAAATGLPAGLRELFGGLAAFPLEDRVRALVGAYLQLVDSDKSRNAILALVRSAVSHDRAAVMLREFLTASYYRSSAGSPVTLTRGSAPRWSGASDRRSGTAPRAADRAVGPSHSGGDHRPGLTGHRAIPAAGTVVTRACDQSPGPAGHPGPGT